jgi:uncharacterized protein YwgA
MTVSSLPSAFQLAGLIAAHRDGVVRGRTRLQKTVYLLQYLGLPTDYRFSMLHYGPYSEALHTERGQVEHLGLLAETEEQGSRGPYYVLTAKSEAADFARIVSEAGLEEPLACIERADGSVLELAATYWYYREQGLDPADAQQALLGRKPAKSTPTNVQAALALLRELGLEQ